MSLNIGHRTPITVLLIEDNIGDYFLFEEYLSEVSSNILINHCENFEEAIAFLSKNKNVVSVIFSDLYLPDVSEMELVKNLMEYSTPIPIILLSGYENQKIIQESKKLGAFDFFMKDHLSPELLKESISKAIKNNYLFN